MDGFEDYRHSLASTVVGDLKVLPGIESPQLGNQRDILVLLPEDYGQGDARYPVLYMHDGQNVFDAATSFAGEWCVDETLAALAPSGLQMIVVGIPNMGTERINEYSPYRHDGRGGNGKRYVSFIADTLKPRIDRTFRTRPEPEQTGIIGSSMGGLISLFAYFSRPDVFGICGAMSPSLWFGKRSTFALVERTPVLPGTLYLDAGTVEGYRTLHNARLMRDLLLRKGYREGCELLYLEEEGGEHNEPTWSRRFARILPELFRTSPIYR